MSDVLPRIDKATLEGMEKNLPVLREPERNAEVLANILQTLLSEIRESWSERDQLRAEAMATDGKLREVLAWAESLVDGAACAFCAPPYVQNIASLVLAREHMPKCKHHPLHAARARVAVLEDALRSIVNDESTDGVDCAERWEQIARRALEGK